MEPTNNDGVNANFNYKGAMWVAIGINGVLLFGIILWSVWNMSSTNPEDSESNPTVTPVVTALPTVTVSGTSTVIPTVTSAPTATSTVMPTLATFSNTKVAITLQNGWTASGLANGSVNISKNGFILYINPSFSQVSGVRGARFAEISSGAPSADLVTVFQPASECSTPIVNTTTKFKRHDIYTNGSVDSVLCVRTTDNSERWYFSFYVKESPYVSYLSANSSNSYVITLSVNASTVNDLPKKGDSGLATLFSEVNTMVDSVIIK